MSISKKVFGNMPDGAQVYLFSLVNANGMQADITNYGGIIVNLLITDREGKLDDITLGYDKLESYFGQDFYFGAIIGRYANRLEDARFELSGKVYNLYKNDGGNHLHGGLKGFDKVVWRADIVSEGGNESLELKYLSHDGEENYPGNLDVTVLYTLTDDNALRIDYRAVSDQDTIVNLTNHAYFNLSGHNAGSILKHRLMLNADKFTPIDNEGIPTGEIRNVKGTAMDFTTMREIAPGLDSGDEQIKFGQGYDHNWVLNVNGKTPEKAAELHDPESGRVMEVYTTMPGVQFYSGNFLGKGEGFKDGAQYQQRGGLCLETQYFPNSVKYRNFPSPILRKGQKYSHTTIYRFPGIKQI